MHPLSTRETHAALAAGTPVLTVELEGRGYDHAAAKRQLETLRETLDAYEAGAWAALDALAAAAGSSAEAVQAALLASVPALIAIPWKPHTSQAHTHALLSDIARAMGASPNKL